MAKNASVRAADTQQHLTDPACEAERRDLLELSERILAHVPQARITFQAWLNAIHGLNEAACISFTPEAALSRLTAELRRLWLKTAHKSADQHMKSPLYDAEAPTTPTGHQVHYGYERDLRPRALERRCATYAPTPAGWNSDHVLFSSAQGGLASTLHWAQEQGIWTATDAPHVTLAGNYFETQDLLDLFCHSGLTWAKTKTVDPSQAAAGHSSRVMIIEPIFFDEGVNVVDIGAFHRVWQDLSVMTPTSEPALLILDTTLSGRVFPIDEFLLPLSGPTAPIVVNVRSGLKLDQAGLELASAGLVSVYRPTADADQVPQMAERLREIRSSTGVGLTLDEISALEAPWFLDRHYATRYADAVFENNAKLADALKGRLELFAQVLHPKFARATSRWAQAPYCVLRLREPTLENYEALAGVISEESARRHLLFDRGGSFGFRGHRYDTVIPGRGRGEPFLRIAMGARGGPSCHGIIDLMRELAEVETMETLRQRSKEQPMRSDIPSAAYEIG